MDPTEPGLTENDLKPLVWRLGILDGSNGQLRLAGDRVISEQEVTTYRDAVDFVMSRQEQTALKLVIGNYREYRSLEAAMVLAHTTEKQFNFDTARESMFHLKRVLLNWLTSIRLLDDHAQAHIARLYGTSEATQYETARNHEYDNNPSYRFVCELRNYAQHVGEVPIHCTIETNLSASELELFFSRDDLLLKFDNWKKVKADLFASPDKILVDDHIEAAMPSVVQLAVTVGQIDQPRFAECIETIKETLGDDPDDPHQRKTIFRLHEVNQNEDGGQSMKMDVLQSMTITESNTGSTPFSIPDFREDRPTMGTTKPSYRCQGPINLASNLPAETCENEATMGFYFAHQLGMALLFACDLHSISLAKWAGDRFGGCFGGEIGKVPHLLELASKLPVGIHMPHGAEYLELVKVPGAPTVSSLFNSGSEEGN